MGYRDDFYIVDNIFGCTGAIHEFPTVYFHSGSEHGRITQEHGYSQNVGRNEVIDDPTYEVVNENVKGELKCVEKRNGRTIHTSRNKLKTVDELTAKELDVLAQSIWKYQEEKYISAFSSKDIKTIETSKKQMKKVLADVKKQR